MLPNGALKRPRDNEPDFHGYSILGQTNLSSPEARRIVMTTLSDGVESWNQRELNCFEPRHGIRAANGSQTYDFVICFSCNRMLVYSSEADRKTVWIAASPNALNDIFKAAHVPFSIR